MVFKWKSIKYNKMWCAVENHNYSSQMIFRFELWLSGYWQNINFSNFTYSQKIVILKVSLERNRPTASILNFMTGHVKNLFFFFIFGRCEQRKYEPRRWQAHPDGLALSSYSITTFFRFNVDFHSTCIWTNYGANFIDFKLIKLVDICYGNNDNIWNWHNLLFSEDLF